MKSKTVWLMGGLGNVLFQLFASKVIISQYPGSIVYVCDRLLEKNWLTCEAKWSIHEKTYKLLFNEIRLKNKPLIIPLIVFIFKKINFQGNRFMAFYNNENFSRFNSSNIFGYFQSKAMICNNKEEFTIFCNEIENKLEKIEGVDTVVHYRSGDSSWAKINYIYYCAIREKIMNQTKIIDIVTDDIVKAQSFFDGCKNIRVKSSANSITDFSLLISAKIIYCAPSTFSWWAVHISKKCEKVFMPKFLFEKLGFHKNFVKLEII